MDLYGASLRCPEVDVASVLNDEVTGQRHDVTAHELGDGAGDCCQRSHPDKGGGAYHFRGDGRREPVFREGRQAFGKGRLHPDIFLELIPVEEDPLLYEGA
ncbi:MAG: hypothetical protein A4E61_00458 [Syntrophorhabdus sp. PtaB.Bin184]|nr:MAG: hypothetical protein A4E61_00458 [Syntrophorhabdus sp. PtaB.Bin184]